MRNRPIILIVASIGITVLLLAFVTALLAANYTSQASLKATLLQRFQAENERLATDVSSFFGSRRQDLFSLVSSGMLDLFFENRNLGQQQSLPSIRQTFLAMMDRIRAGNEWPCGRMALIDESGAVLVDAQAPDWRGTQGTDMTDLVEPRHGNTVLVAQDGGAEVLLSHAYYFRGRYAGQLLAWIRTQFLFDNVMLRTPGSSSVSYLMSGDDVIPNRASPTKFDLPPIEPSHTPLQFNAIWKDGAKTRLIAVKNPVIHTPFSLVTVAPARDVFGPLDPRGLLIGMALLAVAIIGSAAVVVRLNLRSLVLEARLQESLVHEEAVTAKNLQLEREITERRQAEQALRESEERFRTLIDTSPDIIYTVDIENGTLLSLNAAFEKITGWQRHAWLGKPFPELVHPDDRELAASTIEEVRRGEPRSRYELRILTRSGEYRAAEFTNNAIFDETKITAAFGTARDVTERKRLEDQLRHAVKMEAVGQLAGGIAHDFNNMLSVIIGYCNFLLDDMQPNDHLRQYVELVMASAERAAHLTHNLLTFSRKQIVSMQPMDLVSVVRKVEPLVSRLVGEAIPTALELPAEPVTVMGDSMQVEQIIMNLAGNARDAMPRGGALEIGVGMTEINEEFRLTRGFGKPGSYAVMTVADTGVGMDNTVRERIFEPFFTTKGTGKGTGLGLSIVFGIVKQHHGYIDVASAPGVGTKFSVYLPLAQTAVIVAEGEHQRDQPRGGDETILVAEDNNEVRSMLVKILRGAGYGVIETVDGDDAVVRFGKEGNSVKLLLCDVIMPNRNGRETYEAIRALKPDIRVLYISGYTADVLNQSGISERDFDFLQKPVQSRDLLRRVRDILDRLQNKGTAGGI